MVKCSRSICTLGNKAVHTSSTQLPIGGLKEKLLAAKYAKIKEVLVPAENKPDVQELDKEITDGLTITFVSSMKEVLNRALV